MGIILNALSIILGGFLGNLFKSRITFKNLNILGIGIMIISIVGFCENIFDITQTSLKSNSLLTVVFSLIFGTAIGDFFNLENRITNISASLTTDFSGVIDSAIFFGVGGLQLCGPIMLALGNDNSQLILKSIIDFPFALMFGMSYGKKVVLSALPVTLCQIFVFLGAIISKNILAPELIKQICSIGYIILFFSGFNLICEKKFRINNINMLMGILILLLYYIIIGLWGYIK